VSESFNLRYPGQYFDKESGLHYNYFRSYDPLTGRYRQADPIDLRGGWNKYGYVSGNPLSFTDPLGLVPNPAEAACVAGPNPVCIGGVAADVLTWVVAPTAVAAMATNAKPPRVNDPEANREWKEYKDRYAEPPPPNLDNCELLRWKLMREKALLAARQAWDAKWGAHHIDAIVQSQRAIANLENKLKDAGCQCP
jgi:RHS repeat-associated protein